uniref:Uncharacterized protein n=1 Tax=Wuchereria bancrofti TaxID=6293 RepID=A0A1I8EKD7_WUCBA
MQNGDVKRPTRVVRYKPVDPQSSLSLTDDPVPEYMNVLGMMKWCAWVALLCSCVSFANARTSDDAKQIVSSFMLSISAVVMSYLQNPQPIIPPWANLL